MAHIKDIIDNDLCIGCGACIYACGEENLKIQLNEEKGFYEPVILNPTKCVDCSCVEVCPSNNIDYNKLAKEIFGNLPNTEIGNVESVYLAQSNDYELNKAASSGGLIKETLKHYLRSGKIQGLIALQHIEKLEYGPVLIESEEEINSLPGSIYHSIDFSDALKILKETSHNKVALVAIPCQLEGIYSYITEHEPALLNKLVLTIGLICGWTYTRKALQAITTYKNIDYDNLEQVTYRGGGPVGHLQLHTKDGRVKNVNRRIDPTYQAAFDRSYNIKRCHFCVNHGNFLADIVVGDAWLPSTVLTQTGISIVIARTREADKEINKMSEHQIINTLGVSTDEVIESQTHRVVFGDFSYPLAEFYKEQNKFAPRLYGPNRNSTIPVDKKTIIKFDQLLNHKIKLQRNNKFKRLLFEKFTKELKPFLMKYINWFLVRILRIKSIKGERKEIPANKMKIFR